MRPYGNSRYGEMQSDNLGNLLVASGREDRKRLKVWHPQEIETMQPDRNGNRTMYRYILEATANGTATNANTPAVYCLPIDVEGYTDITVYVLMANCLVGKPVITVDFLASLTPYDSLYGAESIVKIVKTLTAATAAVHAYWNTSAPLAVAGSGLTVANDARGLNLKSIQPQIYQSGFATSVITKANPMVVTATGHNFAAGDKVAFSSVAGMTELNSLTVPVTVASISGADFTTDLDASGYGAAGTTGYATLASPHAISIWMTGVRA